MTRAFAYANCKASIWSSPITWNHCENLRARDDKYLLWYVHGHATCTANGALSSSVSQLMTWALQICSGLQTTKPQLEIESGIRMPSRSLNEPKNLHFFFFFCSRFAVSLYTSEYKWNSPYLYSSFIWCHPRRAKDFQFTSAQNRMMVSSFWGSIRLSIACGRVSKVTPADCYTVNGTEPTIFRRISKHIGTVIMLGLIASPCPCFRSVISLETQSRF